MHSLRALVISHYLGILFAVAVGFLYVAPQMWFVAVLGEKYQGIPMLQTPNEDSYLARIQEIIDGHGSLGSPFLYEYKNLPPLSPPTGEWLYALPALLFDISPATVLVVSKFILPAVLFLLVYALILRLTRTSGWQQKLNAIACALLIVLGYDLIDYRTVLSYLQGDASPGSFLLWARPVNPILGAIFLFSFLLFVWAIMENTKRRKSAVVGAAAFLALMFGSYFFSWGIALSALAALILIFLLRKEYRTAGTLALIAPFGVLLASPYWIGVWSASQHPWYEESVLRSGLFLTHYPLLNKLLLVALALYLLVLAIDFLWQREKGIPYRFVEWHWFCLALVLGGLWAFSQQMLTGRTIWPYHFVQYTIPLAMLSLFALLYHVIREWSQYLWGGVTVFVAISALSFGIYTQMSTYVSASPLHADLQNYRPLFDFLNGQEKDCVVFVNETNSKMSELNILIPAFTHCNRYVSSELYSIVPENRAVAMYQALLRMRGVAPDDISDYLHANRSEAAGYLYSNWKGIYGVKDFPDFSDQLLEERLRNFPEEYRVSYAKDFRAELERYRLDYILSDGPLHEGTTLQIYGLTKAFESGGKVLYAF